jgi:MFS family permease
MPSMMVAALGIALPEVRRAFQLSEVEAGSLFSVMMMLAATTSGIAGRCADKFGRKRVLITGLTLLALGFSLAGISRHRILFFGCLALTGIGYGFTPPSLYAIMSDVLPARRGLGASLVSVSYGIGGAVGAILASTVTAAVGWRAAFVTVGGIAAADMLLQYHWIRNLSTLHTASRGGSFTEALTPQIFVLALAECVGGSVFWSSAAWTPTLLRTAKSLSLQHTGWIMGILSMANMLGSFSLGYLSDRFGRKRVIALSALPAAVAAFIVFSWLDSPIWIALGIFVFGILKASVPALIVALAQEAALPGNAGAAAGIIMSLHYTAGMIAPLITAHILGATGDIVLAMIAATSLPLTLFACLIGTVKERRRASSPVRMES